MTNTTSRVPSAIERLDALSPLSTICLATLLGSVAVSLDVLTGSELSFSIFYVAPVSIIAWRLGRTPGLAAAVVAAGAWYGADVINGNRYSQPLIPIWNTGVRLGYFTISATLAVVVHSTMRQRTDEARLDQLTGLLNRRGFIERADAELARARRYGFAVTLAYVDLDDFKLVNDSAGHAAGDDLLRQFGAAVGLSLRQIDVVARMGGDEFAFLLPGTSATDALAVIERLRSPRSDGAAEIRFSLGAVTFATAPDDIDDALRRADELMYQAKADGGGTVRHEVV